MDGFAAGPSKRLVNRHSNKLVNIQSTKMMKKHLREMSGKTAQQQARPVAALEFASDPYRWNVVTLTQAIKGVTPDWQPVCRAPPAPPPAARSARDKASTKRNPIRFRGRTRPRRDRRHARHKFRP